MSTVLILGIIIIIIFIIYMKTDFFSSDDTKDTKNSTETKNKKLNKKKSVILEEDKSEDDELTMKKINIEIKKLSEAIISDERSLKKYKSSDKRDMSDISYDQSSEVGERKREKIKNIEKKKINQNIKNKLEKITEKDDEDDDEDDDEKEAEEEKIIINKRDENTISKTSEDNKVQLYNEFKKFLLEKKKEEENVKKVEINQNEGIKKGVIKKGIIKKGILKKVDDNKTIQEMHKLANQLKNKLHIDENTNYIQNFVPNYDLSDTISGIINNELQKN
jgi:hypothetical protein